MTDDKWVARGKWLVDRMRERTVPDGRTVIETEPIWVKPEGTIDDYIEAVDDAMNRMLDLTPVGPGQAVDDALWER